jgi:hypothetical protein
MPPNPSPTLAVAECRRLQLARTATAAKLAAVLDNDDRLAASLGRLIVGRFWAGADFDEVMTDALRLVEEARAAVPS